MTALPSITRERTTAQRHNAIRRRLRRAGYVVKAGRLPCGYVARLVVSKEARAAW